MKMIIVEDELPAKDRLWRMIQDLQPSAELLGHYQGIQELVPHQSKLAEAALVFLDIHLSDGTGFELLERIPIACPIIFTTAYDEHALQAFSTNGIAYLLKPIKRIELQNALEKIQNLQTHYANTQPPIVNTIVDSASFKTRFLVRFGDTIKTILVADIAYFYTEHRTTKIKTKDNRSYPLDLNMDHVEAAIDPNQFFRINRQYLISLASIAEMKTHTKGRVFISLTPSEEDMKVVSAERAAAFKKWLGAE